MFTSLRFYSAVRCSHYRFCIITNLCSDFYFYFFVKIMITFWKRFWGRDSAPPQKFFDFFCQKMKSFSAFWHCFEKKLA